MPNNSFNSSARKKATNLTVNSDLLVIAKQLNLNLSNILESALADIVQKKLQEQWLAENKDAIEEYNQRILAKGTFGDKVKQF